MGNRRERGCEKGIERYVNFLQKERQFGKFCRVSERAHVYLRELECLEFREGDELNVSKKSERLEKAF